ncbi:MAG TPA: Asp23/Gls24 family envelope stress response protein [Ktedonobacterales bacterium]|nr:Asp23/Gls24 family envelope stress response protein [Ktedonobacterales bacterium]
MMSGSGVAGSGASAPQPERSARLLSLRATGYHQRDERRNEQAGTPDARQPGSVRIARRVMRTVIEEATLRTPGVARLAEVSPHWPQALGRPFPRHGIGLIVHGEQVIVDIYLVVRPDANMVTVGSATQEAVCAAIERLLGLSVRFVNVFIQDVASDGV